MDDKNIFIKRKMTANPFYMAGLEIIIPFHGEHSRVTKLMEGIFNTVRTNRYLVTLVDDCSPNKHWIKQIEKGRIAGVRCFRQSEHKGFGAAVNLALKNPWKFVNNPRKQIPYVMILQSDIQLEERDWLIHLSKTFMEMEQKNVAMVSPMTNNPGSQKFLMNEKASPKEDRILTNGFLPMYCTLAHRDLFAQVGPLKETPYASIEAEDYAIRMASRGFKQGVSGRSWVRHDAGTTLAHFASDPKVQEILRKVKEQFLVEHKKEPSPS